MSRFQAATKKQARGRMAICGPSGGGKTFTALRIAKELAGSDGRIAVIDTERGSASKYVGEDGIPEFAVLELESFSPKNYVAAIADAEKEGFTVIVIDSFSHAWSGKDGAIEMADKAATRSKSGNTFNAWKEVTPEHNDLVEAILQSKAHVIVTMRVKTEYVQERDERTGKMAPRKVGLAPVQRAGVEYEFDVVADVDQENNFSVSKTRCNKLNGWVAKKAGVKEGQIFAEWLGQGAPPAPVVTTTEDHTSTATDAGLTAAAITAQIELSANLEELTTARDRATSAHKDGKITREEYNALGAAYMAKKTTL